MWKFSRLPEEKKVQVRALYEKGDTKGLDKIFREHRVYPNAACQVCHKATAIMEWTKYGIENKLL